MTETVPAADVPALLPAERPPVNRFSIYLIDPDRLFREGIKRILDDSAYETVGEARSIEEARGLFETGERIDLVALDAGDWEAAGIAEFLRDLRARIEGVKVVVLTSDRSRGTIGKAIGWSVDAYLLKDMSPEALTRSLQLVLLGQQIFPTRLMASLLQAEAAEPAAGESFGGAGKGLSPREVQILRHLMNGYSNKAIARALEISEATVKVHLKALLRKVRVSNRTQAAVWAMNNGIGDPAGSGRSVEVA
jgi:two-component system, NarL family, nitrate/nitrite response regulator NarL